MTGVDGALFYDDNSDQPLASDPLIGIDTIAPGESVIYLVAWENPFDDVLADAIAAFVTMWEPLGNVQIGSVTFGGGLGTEGDAVNIFDGNTAEAQTIDRAAYLPPVGEPSFVSEADGTWLARVAEIGVLGARLGNLPADDMEAGPPIGSPGVVPEPNSLVLLSVGLGLSFLQLRRKNDPRVRTPIYGHGIAPTSAAPRVHSHVLHGSILPCCVALWLVVLFGNLTAADLPLKITEIWPGALPGTEFTSDWFEVTNFGDVAATNLNGNLYFDDSSNDPLSSDPMVGIDTIAPGESVIYLTTWEDGFNGVLDDAIAAFRAMWRPPAELQVGSVTLGSGFGGNGDAANIFTAAAADATLIDHVEYPGPAMGVASFVSDADGTWIPLLAEPGKLGAYAGYYPADDSSPDPAIGSPGIVPEPMSGALMIWAFVVVLATRTNRSRC